MVKQDRLIELFTYDVENGGLINRKCRGGTSQPGVRAGHVHSRGYRHIIVDRKLYKEHILVWVLLNGAIPEGMQIDHKDRVRDNNRIENLRLGTRFDNQHNRKENKNNTSGYKGVSFYNGKWVAEIMSNRKKHRLGKFETKEDAAKAYNEASKRLHGDFAHTNEV